MYNNNLKDAFLILFTKSSRIELLSVRINSFLFPSLFLTEFQLFPFETTFFLRRDFSSDIVLLIFTCRSCWNGLRAIRNRENKDLIKGNFNSEDRSEESDPDERSIYLVPDLCNKVLNFDTLEFRILFDWILDRALDTFGLVIYTYGRIGTRKKSEKK